MTVFFNAIETEFTANQLSLKNWLEQKNLQAEAEIIYSYFNQKYKKTKVNDGKSLEAVLMQLQEISDILLNAANHSKSESLSKLRWKAFHDETRIVKNNTLALIKMTPWATIAVSLTVIGYSLAPMLLVPGVMTLALACFSAVVLATCLYKFIKEARNLDFSFFKPIKAYNAEHRVINNLLTSSDSEQPIHKDHIITREELSPRDNHLITEFFKPIDYNMSNENPVSQNSSESSFYSPENPSATDSPSFG